MPSRINQIVFVFATLALCWFGMMALHELGHIVGAIVTGGTVQRVVLNPLAISRTDVSPNPYPAIVVWLGPILGCVLPSALPLLVRRRFRTLRAASLFFCGVCLVANGAYIGVGSFDKAGDCREMLRTGSPQWLLIAFGAASIVGGFTVWHRLGSMRRFMSQPELITERAMYTSVVALAGYVAIATLLTD